MRFFFWFILSKNFERNQNYKIKSKLWDEKQKNMRGKKSKP